MKVWGFVLVLAVSLLAGALRLTRLDLRPLHADEAIQADKFGTLLETGEYRYDPRHYHGPTLNYLTLPSAWLAGVTSYSSLNEVDLRIVPAITGWLLVLMPFLFGRALPFQEAAVCATLTAVSPAMTYYSRYYIHEIILTFFASALLACLFRYLSRPRLVWAVAGGLSAGLLLATKETALISLGSLFAALVLAMLLRRRRLQTPQASGVIGGIPSFVQSSSSWSNVLFRDGASFLSAALVVASLFSTSFLKHPAGIRDFLTAYPAYADRAVHDPFHIHPWHYYFDLLLFFKETPGAVWSEAFIVILAIIGGWYIVRNKTFSTERIFSLRVLLLFTVLLTLAYAAIPYKTPWCLLGFLHAMILLAGIGAMELLGSLSRSKAVWLIGPLMIAATFHLFSQSLLGNFKYFADPRNPYVYAHTGTDVFKIRDKLESLAKTDPHGYDIQVQIYSRKNLWPLPWYLRKFRRVEWWTQVLYTTPIAPVVLATPEMESALVHRLYDLPPPGQRELYLRFFDHYVELRPSVEIRGYIAKSFWDNLRNVEGN